MAGRKPPLKNAVPARPGQSASERVARAIIRNIYDGTFVSGQRLVEPDLMELLGASRSAVREAIKRLEGHGVVDVLPHRGALIRRLSEREAQDALLVIEYCAGLAARLAAERIDEDDNRTTFIAALDGLLSHRDADDSYEQIRARNRFYRALALISGSRDLQRFIPNLQVHLLRNRFTLPAKIRFRDYDAIGAAILAGDPAHAEATIRDHIRRSGSDEAAVSQTATK